MHKRILIFLALVMMVPLVYLKSMELDLAYYVYSTLLILPLYYLYDAKDRPLFTLGLLCFICLETVFIFENPIFESFLLVAGHGGVLGFLIMYQRLWQTSVVRATRRNDAILREWEILKHKHEHRLENLHHLEKQASSLMDLFEIARDFSECLSFDVLLELLFKKVRPELSFDSLRLILVMPGANAEDSAEIAYKCYTVNQSGYKAEEQAPSEHELHLIEGSREKRKMIVEGDYWFFPLYSEDSALAYLTVDGAEQGDLAKFEVLVAHLVLQIKKIKLYERVRGLSIIDGLTQVFVRRHFMELFEGELKRSLKHRFSLALLMLDIDHFKRYNDDFGHLVGDATLREVAALLRSSLRKVDIVGRHGGEEFVIVMPETEVQGALEVAERIRSNIARHTFRVYDVNTKVTASLGVTVFPSDMSAPKTESYRSQLMEELIVRADRALYQAKEEGRNRVVLYKDI